MYTVVLLLLLLYGYHCWFNWIMHCVVLNRSLAVVWWGQISIKSVCGWFSGKPKPLSFEFFLWVCTDRIFGTCRQLKQFKSNDLMKTAFSKMFVRYIQWAGIRTPPHIRKWLETFTVVYLAEVCWHGLLLLHDTGSFSSHCQPTGGCQCDSIWGQWHQGWTPLSELSRK